LRDCDDLGLFKAVNFGSVEAHDFLQNLNRMLAQPRRTLRPNRQLEPDLTSV